MLGGDSFPQLTVEEGREALYLRFEASGEVCENRRSQTYYQNQSRNNPGAADRPDELGADVPPDWVLVSTTGSYAWHDHRIHWMSPSTLPFRADVDEGGEAAPVDPSLGEPQPTTVWAEPVPIQVDGDQVGIVGEVTYLPDASPAPALVAALVVLVAVVGLGVRAPVVGIVGGALAGSVLAVVVALPQLVGLPAGVEGQPLQLVLPLIAVLVAVAGLSVRSRSPFAVVVAGAAGVPLLGWVVANLGALSAPIVPPGTLPDALVRVALGVTAGGGLGALVVGVRDLFAGDALALDPEHA